MKNILRLLKIGFYKVFLLLPLLTFSQKDTLTIIIKIPIESKFKFINDTIYNCGKTKVRFSKDSIYFYGKHQYFKIKNQSKK